MSVQGMAGAKAETKLMNMNNVVFDVMNAMAIGNPNAQAKITQIPDPEPSLVEDWSIEPGWVYKLDGRVILIHPSDMLTLRYPNMHPHYTLGHAEARRDKRKYRRISNGV